MSSAEPSRPDVTPPARGRARPLSKRWVLWSVFFILLVVAYGLGGRMLREFGEWWVVDEPPVRADAILVLEDDDFGALRCRRAAELYREGWAPVVVAAGRYLRPYYTLPDVMRRDLIEFGVPESAVIALPYGRGDAMDEAQVVRELVVRKGWKRVLFVTSNSHTRRAHYIFSRVLGGIAEVRTVAAGDPAFNPEDWWRHRGSIGALVREVVYFITATLGESPARNKN